MAKVKKNSPDLGLKILNAQDYSKGMYACVHSSGRLGFSSQTARALRFEKGKAIKLALDEDDNLVLINSGKLDPEAFALMQSNGFFSVKTTHLFDQLGIDYFERKVRYELKRLSGMTVEAYRMVEVVEKRKTKKSIVKKNREKCSPTCAKKLLMQ